jgi:hypothetical protein
MPTSIATLIEESAQNLRSVINSPDVNASLRVQAESLKRTDHDFLRRRDLDFHVPKKEDLPPHLSVSFNPLLAESLLHDGSLLLDRCVQQQQELFDLKTKWFETCLQVDELLRLNKITADEESSYHFTVEVEEKNLEALKLQRRALLDSNDLHKRAVDLIVSKRSTLGNLSGASAWASAFEIRNPGGGRADESIGFGPFGIADKKARDHTRDFAMLSTDYEQAFRSLTIEEIIKRNANEVLVIDQKIASAERSIELRKKQLELQNETGTQVKRNEVARFVAKRRVDAKTQKNGPLNYKDRIALIESRFDDDLTAAWLRLAAAARGFFELYDYPIDETVFSVAMIDEGFDGFLPVHSIAIRTFDLQINFDKLFAWCQKMNTWLASFLDTQQQTTRSFSLSRLLTTDEFEAGKLIHEGRAIWKIRLNHGHFFNRSFVRIRNISLQTNSNDSSGNWNFALTPPSDASILKGGALESYLDQSRVGRLFLGRVNDRTYTVVPEANSSPRLYNCSPVGFHTTLPPRLPINPSPIIPTPPGPVPPPVPIVGQPPPNRSPGSPPIIPPGVIPPIPGNVIPRASPNPNPGAEVRTNNFWTIEVLAGAASNESISRLNDLDVHITVALV